jgi:hypothetical protein
MKVKTIFISIFIVISISMPVFSNDSKETIGQIIAKETLRWGTSKVLELLESKIESSYYKSNKDTFAPENNNSYSNFTVTENLTADDFGRFPQTSLRPIVYSEIKNLNCSELLVMRNEIYARYGREFKRKVVRTYFEAQSWYKINNYFKESILTDLEIRNAKYILSEEKRRKCF